MSPLRAECTIKSLLDLSGDPHAVYIIVLHREKGAEPECGNSGMRLLARWSNRVVVELTPAALEAMKGHGRVNAQHIINGPVTAATAPSSEQVASGSFVPRATSGGGTLQWTTGDYHYDSSDNIDRIGADGDGYTRRFVYDELDRLVEAGLEAPAAAPGTYANYSRYTYDSFGNRLSEVTPAVNQTMTADKNTNRVTLSGTTVTYDGVGNMTQGGGLMFQYDPFNNLKEVDAWGGAQKMAIYNADDERIIFCGDGSLGPCRWTLRGNGNEVLREYESGPIGNGSFYWAYYLWVEDSVYRGSLLAGAQRETAEGGRLYFHLDHLGSPRLTTNAAGQKVTANEFAPFGRELTSITQEAQLGYDHTETHRFTGHERDFVEGTTYDNVNFVDYMHARSYTPVFGRFLSVDPVINVKRAMADPQAWNRYVYALNNPLNYTDPTGRDVSIGITFKGDGWTDEMKRAVIGRVTQFYTGLHIGHAYVFDSAKAKHSSFFAWKLRGYADITADAALTKGQHEPGLVRAGVFLQDASLSLAQKANAIANTIDHETLAHQFGATYDNIFDFAHYNRDLQFAKQYPELSQYFGTVADSHIANDPQYRGRLFSGPLPVHPHDLGVAANANVDYMHARYYSANVGRFLSVDPVIPVSSLRAPQRWNRYTYVMNNPMRFTDPAGTDIVLSGCAKDAGSSACKDQLAAAQSAFGKAWSSINYKNGVITLKDGVSPLSLSNFGSAAHVLGFMANSKDHFSLIADTAKAAQGGGAFTETLAGGGANIYYDPYKFGGGRTSQAGDMTESLAGVFVHESGHGIEPYLASVQGVNANYWGNEDTRLRREAFPVFLENAWRRNVLGAANNDIRTYYTNSGDIRYPGTHLEDIWP